MKFTLLLFVAIASAHGQSTNAEEKLFFPVLVTPGRSFTNARIDRATPVEAVVYFDGGIVKVPMSNMPAVVQEKYHYSQKAADEFAAQLKAKAAAEKTARLKQAEELSREQKRLAYESLVTVRPDKFLKLTTFQTGEIPLGSSINCQAVGFTNAEASTPENIYLRFISTSPDWRFLDGRNLIILRDGKTFDLGEIKHTGSVHRDSVLEQMTAEVPFADFAKIAFADTVEIRLGLYELKFPHAARAPLRALSDRFAPPMTNAPSRQ